MMASAPSASPAPSFYADSLENGYPGRKCKWFLDTLRGRRPDVPVPFHQEQISTIRIVDDTGLTSRSEQFDALKGTEVSEDFVDTLVRPLPCTSLRLVIVHFSKIQHLNFAYMSTLGSVLNIDPSFFVMHFEYSRGRHDRWSRDRAPSLLPLESRHLQFRKDNWGHMTLTKLTLKSSQNNVGSYRIQLSASEGFAYYRFVQLSCCWRRVLELVYAQIVLDQFS